MSYRAEAFNFFSTKKISFILTSIRIDEDLDLTDDKKVTETNFFRKGMRILLIRKRFLKIIIFVELIEFC